jgi:hypothetical protein
VSSGAPRRPSARLRGLTRSLLRGVVCESHSLAIASMPTKVIDFRVALPARLDSRKVHAARSNFVRNASDAQS